MPSRLLARQIELLEYLTSGDAIFGDARPHALAGLDFGRLRLEARLSHAKRMEKVRAVLPCTLAASTRADPAIVRRFAYACPSTEVGRLENARQFQAFLQRRRKAPRYLRDLAACEMAMAEVLAEAEEQGGKAARAIDSARAVRRAEAVRLLSLSHDVRAALAGTAGEIVPPRRKLHIAVGIPGDRSYPQIVELPGAAFDFLKYLDDWVDLAGLPAVDGLGEMLADFSRLGLVDLRP